MCVRVLNCDCHQTYSTFLEAIEGQHLQNQTERRFDFFRPPSVVHDRQIKRLLPPEAAMPPSGLRNSSAPDRSWVEKRMAVLRNGACLNGDSEAAFLASNGRFGAVHGCARSSPVAWLLAHIAHRCFFIRHQFGTITRQLQADKPRSPQQAAIGQYVDDTKFERRRLQDGQTP